MDCAILPGFPKYRERGNRQLLHLMWLLIASSRPGARRCATNPTGSEGSSARCAAIRGRRRIRETIRRVQYYFVKNRNRMRYSELRAEKLAIGSGAVGAANKTLAAARMKCSGMRWHIKSGQAILSFRLGDNDGQKRWRRQ